MSLLSLVLAGVALAQDAGAPNPLVGEWKLDAKASSDVSALLEHFDANFVVKHFASSVSPTNTIEWNRDRFTLVVHAITVTKNTLVVLDGKTPTSDDLFGSPYSYTSTLEDGAVVSHGTVDRKDGTHEALAMRRTVEPDGTMALKMTITAPDGRVFEVKRVFNRVKP